MTIVAIPTVWFGTNWAAAMRFFTREDPLPHLRGVNPQRAEGFTGTGPYSALDDAKACSLDQAWRTVRHGFSTTFTSQGWSRS
jgi:hypothetical protein